VNRVIGHFWKLLASIFGFSLQWSVCVVVVLNICAQTTWLRFTVIIEAKCSQNCPIVWSIYSIYASLFMHHPPSVYVVILGQWDKGDRVHMSFGRGTQGVVLRGGSHSCTLFWHFSLCSSEQCHCWEAWSSCCCVCPTVYSWATDCRAGTVSFIGNHIRDNSR